MGSVCANAGTTANNEAKDRKSVGFKVTISLVILALLSLVLFGLSYSSKQSKNDSSEKRCLIILSGGIERAASEQILLALNNELKSRGLKYILTLSCLTTDYTGVNSIDPAPELLETLPLFFPTLNYDRSQQFDYDLVIAIGRQALYAATNPKIYPIPASSPLLFCNCSTCPQQIERFETYSGVFEKRDVPATLQAGLALYPDTTELLVLCTNASDVPRLQKSLTKLIAEKTEHQLPIRFICASDYSTRAMLSVVKNAPSTSLLLLESWPISARSGSLTALGLAIQNIMVRPYFSTDEALLGCGSLGGYFTCYHWQAGRIASMAEHMTQVTPKSALPLVQGVPQPVFDLDLLKLFMLDRSKLPKNTLFFSFGQASTRMGAYKQNSGKILTMVGVFALMLGFVIYHYYYRNKQLYELLKQTLEPSEQNAPGCQSIQSALINDVDLLQGCRVGYCLQEYDPKARRCGKITAINDAWRLLFGHEHENWIGKEAETLLPCAVVDHLRASVSELADSPESTVQQGELLLPMANSDSLYLNIIQFICSEPNNSSHSQIVTIAIDNTPLYKRFALLQDGCTLFRALLQHLPGYVYIKNRTLEDRYAFVSANYMSDLSDSSRSVVGLNDSELYSEDKVRELKEFENSLLAQAGTETNEDSRPSSPLSFKLKNRTDIRWHGCLVKTMEAEFFIGLGFVKNDTRRIELLRHTSDFYLRVADSLPSALYIQDVKNSFRFVNVNRKFLEVTGFKWENIRNICPEELNWPTTASGIISAEDEIAHCRELVRTGRSTQRMVSFKGKQGEQLDYRLIQALITCRNGRQFIASLGLDVSLENDLLDCKEILNRSIEAIALQPDHEECLALVGNVFTEKIECDRFAIALLDDESSDCQVIYEKSNPALTTTAMGHSQEFYNKSFNAVREYLVPEAVVAEEDISKRPFFSTNPFWKQMRSVIATGIFAENNRLVGLVYFAYAFKQREFTKNDIAMVCAVGRLLSIIEMRHRKNKDISKGEHLLLNVINSISLPIWIFNRKGQLSQTNTAAAGFASDFLPEEAKQITQSQNERISQVLSSSKSAMRQLAFGAKTFLLYTQPLYDTNNELSNIIEYGIEITSLLTAQHNEDKQRVTLQGLLDAIPLGVVVKSIDNEFRYVICNNSFCRMVNRTQEEILGHKDEELQLFPSIVNDIVQYDHLASKENKVFVNDITFGIGSQRRSFDRHRVAVTTQSGEHMLVSVFQENSVLQTMALQETIRSNCMAEALNSQNITNSIKYVLQQATKHFQADYCLVCCINHQRNILTPAFEYSTKPSYAMISKLIEPNSIIFNGYNMLDFDSYINSTMQLNRITYSPQDPWYLSASENMPYFVTDLREENPQKTLRVLGSLGQLAVEGRVKSLLIVGIYVNGILWGSVNLAFINRSEQLTTDGIAFFGTLVHIIEMLLERNASLNQLIKALEKSQEANRTKRFLLASLSDKLRNPLGSIISTLDMAINDTVSEEFTKPMLDDALIAGKRLNYILNSLMLFSDLGSYDGSSKVTRINCFELLDSIFEHYRNKAAHKRLKAELVVDPSPELMLDAKAVIYILLHLLDNAIMFTSKGFIRLGASFKKTDSHTGIWRVYVADSGCGIEPEKLALIKNTPEDPFKNPNFRDYGLGLNVARGIVKAIGGRENVESTLKQGTVFSFELDNVEYFDT